MVFTYYRLYQGMCMLRVSESLFEAWECFVSYSLCAWYTNKYVLAYSIKSSQYYVSKASSD